LEALLLAENAHALGVRVIALDRPGIGRSDPTTGDRLMDWPDDVVDIADQLGIPKFAVEGISAGGPYALACAYKIPHRLTSCGVISTVAPSDIVRKIGPCWMRAVWWLGTRFPETFHSFLRLAVPNSVPNAAGIEKRLVRLSTWVAKSDRVLLRTPELGACLARSIAESRRQGGEANRQEALAQIRPWGFRVELITYERIFIWHGEQDRVMPIAPARLLAKALPHCTARFFPGEGHFSTIMNHAQEIFGTLGSEPRMD
jgi:pimeloyl-ACP methyl ester carboxylesterase